MQLVNWFLDNILVKRERRALREISELPIPPNDVNQDRLQSCCYEMRYIAEKGLGKE